jgi:Uma2 family endonuclease
VKQALSSDVFLLLSSAEGDYRMLMATKTRRWKRADLRRLPDDGNRYEVLDGELFVTPQAAYEHQRVALALMLKLAPYCTELGIAEAIGPGAVIWEKNELQPDIQVIPGIHASRRGAIWEELPLPLLVVEVLSDSTWRRDVGKKRDAYLRLTIPTYWIVDCDERSVAVWNPGATEPLLVTDILRWAPLANAAPLEIRLDSIFG